MTWDDPRGYGPLAEVGRAFGADVTVQWDVQPLAGFESRSVPELARDYDLLNLDHPHIGEAVAAGALRPVGELADDFLGPSLASYWWAGQLWAVPVDAACQVAAYHPARLAAPPRSYAEALALRQPVAASLVGVHALMALLTLLNARGTPLVDYWPAGLELAADQLRELTARCLPESLDWNPLQLLAALGAGRFDYAVFTFAYVNFQKQGVRFAPVPSRGAVVGGTGLAVSAHSRHPEAALAWARLAGSLEVQTTIWPQHGGQPAHRAAWDDLAKSDPFYRDLRPAIETAWVRPRYAGWNGRQLRAGNIINRWLRGARGPRQLRIELEELWNQTGTTK